MSRGMREHVDALTEARAHCDQHRDATDARASELAAELRRADERAAGTAAEAAAAVEAAAAAMKKADDQKAEAAVTAQQVCREGGVL